MVVSRLRLTNFRSYRTADFKLHPAVTIVVGPNASGKTNLLESLYVLSTTRSFRTGDRELISEGEQHFRVEAEADGEKLAIGFSVEQGRRKQVTHGGVKRTLARHLGLLPAVLFEPTDLDLVAGPPEGRRRYLDLILSQTDPHYIVALHRYRRVLQQRNKLLDGFDIESVRGQIFAWDIKLAEAGAVLVERRAALLTHFNEVLGERYGLIAGQPLELMVAYHPSVGGKHVAEKFLEVLAETLPRDLAAGFTAHGPHRDDFKVTYHGQPIEDVASRGEVRTTVLALKLAELAFLQEITGRTPLLLLDDVFSELDSGRRTRLVEQLDNYQTLITTTDADAVTRAVSQPHSIIETGAVRAG
jgi:DNA replication and repair protein RecF